MRRLPVVVSLGCALACPLGCGDGSQPIYDAAPPDGAAGLVSIRYRDTARKGFGGLTVYFQNADSSLALATVTDDNGSANAYMLPGGFVTVRSPTGMLWTYAGVRPGDELEIGQTGAQQGTIPMNVVVPQGPSEIYEVNTVCGETGALVMPTTVVLHVSDACGETTDVLLRNYEVDDLSGTTESYQFRSDVTINGFETIAFPASGYVPATPLQVRVTGIPSEISSVFITQSLASGRASLDQPRNAQVPNVNGTALTSFGGQRAARPPEGTVVTRIDPLESTGISRQHVITWGPGQPSTVVDLANTSLREYAGFPRYEPATTSVTWEESAVGQAGNAVVAGLNWSGPGEDISTWWIFAPRTDRPSISVPVLPDPTLRAPETGVQILVLDTLHDPRGYDSVRRLSLLGSWSSGAGLPVDRGAGKLAFQSLVR